MDCTCGCGGPLTDPHAVCAGCRRSSAKRNRFKPHTLLMIALAAFAVGCGGSNHDRPIGAVVEIKAPLGLPPVPIPADNPPTAESIALGRRLFYDSRLSRDESLSCASCHDERVAFSDAAGSVAWRERPERHSQCTYTVEQRVLAVCSSGMAARSHWRTRQPRRFRIIAKWIWRRPGSSFV